jgi:hypothetical protein
MNKEIYYNKYLKYKNKYINLKGGDFIFNKNIVTEFYNNSQPIDYETTVIEINNDINLSPIYLDESKYKCKKNCFVISLFGKNSDYVIGAINQAQAFIDNNDNEQCDIICICTPDVGKFQINLLSNFFTYVIVLPYLKYEKPIVKDIIKLKPHYAKVWFKLHALRLTNYEKICLIDSDYLSIKPISDIFTLNAPAACNELPNTFIDKEQQIFITQKDGEIILNEYENNWYNLYGDSCRRNKNYSGYLILFLLYTNNNYLGIYDEKGTVNNDIKELHGNYFYGGMNASIMLLKPDIKEFNDIINDLCNYSDDRLRYNYPEQQYLTARYSLQPNIKETQFKNNFSEIFQNLFKQKQNNYIFLKKLFYTSSLNSENYLFQKLLDNQYNLLVLEQDKYIDYLNKHNSNEYTFTNNVFDNSENNKQKLKEKENDIINHMITSLANILWDYYSNNHKISNLYKNEWNCIGLEYYITEYYNQLPEKVNWKGFPILQQTKLWTVQGIDEVNNKPHQKRGHVEWFKQLEKTLVIVKKTLVIVKKINIEQKEKTLSNDLALIKQKQLLNNYIYYLFQKINYINYIIELYNNSLNIIIYKKIYIDPKLNYKQITLNYLIAYYTNIFGIDNKEMIINLHNNKFENQKFQLKRANTFN